MNPPKEGKSLLGKPVEAPRVQRIEISLSDETINKLSDAFAEKMIGVQTEMVNIDNTIKRGLDNIKNAIRRMGI